MNDDDDKKGTGVPHGVWIFIMLASVAAFMIIAIGGCERMFNSLGIP